MRTAINAKAPKPKKCSHCATEFMPFRTTQKVCSPACALASAPVNQVKARKALADIGRKEHRAAKERLKSRGDYMKEAQVEFNAWVRARDADLPCISCGRHHDGQYHAGHYRTVSANPEIRFEPLNVWKQCAPCNSHLSGNLINYRIELIKRIGVVGVEWVEGPHEPKRYTIEDLKAIKAEYRAKTKILKGEAA